MIGDKTTKITGKSNDDVMWWMHEIDRAIEAREPYKKRWDANEAFEDLNQWATPGTVEGEVKFVKGQGDQATVNKFASALRTRRAVLAYHNPRGKFTPKSSGGYEKIIVPMVGADGTPKKGEDGKVAVREVPRHLVAQALFNDIISQPMFGLTQTMTRLAKSGDLSYGVLKTGYMPGFETAPEKKSARQPIPRNEDGSLDFGNFEKNKVTGLPVTKEGGGGLIPKKSIPTWESWFLDWVPAHNILTDPDCGNDEFQMRWIVEIQVRPTEDVKEDPLYKIPKDFKGTSIDTLEAGGEVSIGEKNWIKDKRSRTRLFHVWDMINDKYIVLADGCGEKLRDIPTPDGIAESPFGCYRNNEQAGKGGFLQRPLFTDLLPVAMMYNIAVQDLQRAMDVKRKVFVTDDIFDHISEPQFKSRDDMTLIKIPKKIVADGQPLQTKIAAWSPPPIPQEIYANISRLEMDFYELLGLPPEASGAPKSKTATQVQVMAQYAGTRVETDRNLMAETMRLMFKKLWDSIQAHMTVERAIQIVGPDGEAFTALIERNMIIGDYDLGIDVEEMAPTDKTAQNAQWISAMQVLKQDYWLVAEEALARTYLARFGIKDENYIQSLVRQAQKMMGREERTLALEEAQQTIALSQAQMALQQMQMAPQPQIGGTGSAPAPSPEAPPPESEADALAQTAGGTQPVNMQAAT